MLFAYTVHTGSNEKFTKGWDSIFGETKKPTTKKPATSTSPQTTPKAKKKKKG